MFTCQNLDEFLAEYGDLLAAKARETLAPLHVPARDVPRLPRLYRKPFEAQGHVVEAVKKQWRRAKPCLLVAEMGTGKTFMAAAAVHASHRDRASGCPVGRNALRAEREPAEDDMPVVDVDPWTAQQKLEGSRCRPSDGKGGGKSFSYGGEEWAADGSSTQGVPGRTMGYRREYRCFRVADASSWKKPVTTFADVYNVADNPGRGEKKARVARGSLGISGRVGKREVVFHTPALFRSCCPRAYRAAVVCPGQMVEKWVREIVNTVPGAIVYQVDGYGQVLRLARRHAEYKTYRRRQERWKAHRAAVEAKRAAGGKLTFEERGQLEDATFPRSVSREEAKGMTGNCPMGPEFYVIGRDCLKLSCGWKPVFVRRKGRAGCYCPRCGKALVRPGDKAEPAGPDWFFTKSGTPSARRSCVHCGERLWQEVDRPRKYSPARIIQKKLKGFFDYGIIDEAHEYKSGDSLQGDAVGAIAGSCKKVAALTGTLVGGYAWHVRTLLFRIGGAGSLLAEGLGWKGEMEFNKRFGRIETKTVTSRNAEAEERIKGHQRGRGGKKGTKTTSYVRPGIMPTLFNHLVGQSVFLGLAEVSDDLPPYVETPVPVEMDPEQRDAYDVVDKALTDAIKDLVRKGNKKLLGTMLNCLLCYPDYAYDWGEIGYWDRDEDSLDPEATRWVHVVDPPNLDPTGPRPKEVAAVDYCLAQKAKGRQTWVFACYTDRRDCVARLERFLEAAGLRVGVMRASVPPKDRERWIDAHGPSCDVILSHPQLVQTGLDFFSPTGGHNYCSILFYQTGYNLFTLMQAARRAWRIGQRQPCEVGFLYYEKSMQARAMALMGRKMMAARNLNGQFSAEGLAAMAGEDASLEMELARSLAEAMPTGDKIRSWAKSGSPRKAAPAPAPKRPARAEEPCFDFGDVDYDELEKEMMALEVMG